MKKKSLVLVLLIAVLFIFCKQNNNQTINNEVPTDSTVVVTANPVDNPKDTKIDPFKDFPKDAINAQTGDYVLSPSVNWQRDATTQGTEKVNFIFYNQTIAEVGNEYSKIDFMSEKGVEIPNYMIIPIPQNQKTKKGDIILTWWQSGSGMQRAIVTDATNPSEPKVNYIDIDWNNPAKNNGIPIGQMEEKIKPNTFYVLTDLWQPGTCVAAKKGNDYALATIVKVSGDKVLTIGFAGFMKVYSKSECIPIPNKISVNVGDEVYAPWVGKFVKTKVEKIDGKFGRIHCDDPYSDKPLIVPFGTVLKELN